TSRVVPSRDSARALTQKLVTMVRISAPPGDQMRIVESLPAVAKNRPSRVYSTARISAVWPLWTTRSTGRGADPRGVSPGMGCGCGSPRAPPAAKPNGVLHPRPPPRPVVLAPPFFFFVGNERPHPKQSPRPPPPRRFPPARPPATLFHVCNAGEARRPTRDDD